MGQSPVAVVAVIAVLHRCTATGPETCPSRSLIDRGRPPFLARLWQAGQSPGSPRNKRLAGPSPSRPPLQREPTRLCPERGSTHGPWCQGAPRIGSAPQRSSVPPTGSVSALAPGRDAPRGNRSQPHVRCRRRRRSPPDRPPAASTRRHPLARSSDRSTGSASHRPKSSTSWRHCPSNGRLRRPRGPWARTFPCRNASSVASGRKRVRSGRRRAAVQDPERRSMSGYRRRLGRQEGRKAAPQGRRAPTRHCPFGCRS
jgi:hypothetical protein